MSTSLEEHPIHLGLGATAVVQPPFSGMSWYQGYGERHGADGVEGRLSVLGAIFTPRKHRGRGHATALVREVLRQRASEDRWAMLFTDIGAGYYRRLGFRELPCEEHWGNLPRGTAHGRRPIELRPLEDDDLASVMEAHDRSFGDQALAVVRDRDHVTARTVDLIRQCQSHRLACHGLIEITVHGDDAV